MTLLHDLKRTGPSPSPPPLALALALALPEELPAFLLDPDIVPFFVDTPAFPLGIDPDATAAFLLGRHRESIWEGPRGECIQPIDPMVPLYCNHDIIP